MALAKDNPAPVPRVRASGPGFFSDLIAAVTPGLTWVWGVPGAGKTTLVVSYLAARKLRALWYQFDDADNDLATFFYYLGQAVPRRRRPMPLFTPEYHVEPAMFARAFFRELFSRLKTPSAVVFDNYQELTVNSPIHAIISEALTEKPSTCRIICISRSEPPPSFLRFDSPEAIASLDPRELGFTYSETAGLLFDS